MGAFQVTSTRALFSNLRNAAGAEVGVAAVPLQVSLANTAANGTAVAVSLAANQSINEAQINGVTPLMGAGASGTGAQRVTQSQDTTTLAGSAPGTAGTASANVVSIQGIASMTKLLVTPDANASVNLNQVAGSAISQGHGAAATAIRVELPTDGTGVISPAQRTLVTLDVKTVTTGGTAVTALSSGHRTAGGWLQNPSGATINLCINEIGTATGTTSSGDTTCIAPGQSYALAPASSAVSVVSSDSAHPFSGYGLQ
jgi:hypothetical protein